MPSVLIVEDDTTLASVVARYLQRAGCSAELCTTGSRAVALVEASTPDVVLLDVMLPELDGLEVCRLLRASHPQLPIIMLTALGEVDDRIAGLQVGADDYVTKPFSPRELVLRVQALLRRAGGHVPPGGPIRLGELELDPTARRVTRDGHELNLTVREFDLLAYLLAHPGVAFTRDHLMHEVWGWAFGDQSTVTVHVRRLREKIETDPADPQVIQTVWGVGYRLDAEPAPRAGHVTLAERAGPGADG